MRTCIITWVTEAQFFSKYLQQILKSHSADEAGLVPCVTVLPLNRGNWQAGFTLCLMKHQDPSLAK